MKRTVFTRLMPLALAFALPVVGGGDEAAPFAIDEGEWPWDAAEGYTPFPSIFPYSSILNIS